MPVRQMKLRFDARPITRIVPAALGARSSAGEKEQGNKRISGGASAGSLLGVAGLPPAAGEAPPRPADRAGGA